MSKTKKPVQPAGQTGFPRFSRIFFTPTGTARPGGARKLKRQIGAESKGYFSGRSLSTNILLQLHEAPRRR
jgi:hypothetical protein